ncbi:hypothetical protein ACFXJ8_23685 [Nonomuraea sp. NPDC059194]|uniref:hypothetical protein n=1 Tax=Nonomuraea sp. NPDC059194 TaxID=3346764 RepID=UPI0036818113
MIPETPPERASTTWADFLRSPADALLACDFIEIITLNGQRQNIMTVIEHATLTGIRMPRMNSIRERWVQSCRRELLDRCLLLAGTGFQRS